MSRSNGTAPEQVDGHALLVDVCDMAVTRGWRIAANPKDRAQAVASMEEVYDDPKWQRRHKDLPGLELHDDVPPGRIGFYDPRTHTLTGLISKVQKSKKGLGRIGKLWLPGAKR